MTYEEALMAKAAWYYYFQDLTQQQISERLGISRIRVIRLLEKARQAGMIQFSLRRGNERRLRLEQQLMETYRLQDVFLVPGPVDPALISENAANAAGMYILEHLKPDSFINIGSGETASLLLRRLASLASTPITCVSLTGGVSGYLPDSRQSVFTARLHLIPSPLLAPSREFAESIWQTEEVKRISRMISQAQLSVVGIGSVSPDAPLFRNGILSRSDFEHLTAQGAQGEVLTHFLDARGRLIPSPVEERLISTSLDRLRTLPQVIGVAAGVSKVPAIRAALLAGFLDILISDSDTAEALLTSDPSA